MLITETRLRPTDKLRLRGYTTHRRDRPNQTHVPAGGVAILVRKDVPHTHVHTPQTDIETVAVRLADNTHIISAYNRPQNNFTQQQIHTLLNIGNKVIILGDLNARHSAWNCHVNNNNGRTLHTYINSHNAILLHPPTHTCFPANNNTPTTIDIIIHKNIAHIVPPVTRNELSSDHLPIITKISKHHIHSQQAHVVRTYKQTNWHEFRRTLDTHINLNTHMNTSQDIETHVEQLTCAITNAVNAHTHTYKIKPHKDKLPEHITQIISERNNIRRLWQRTRDPVHRDQVKMLNKEIHTDIIHFRNDCWRNKLTSLNPNDQSLWKVTHSLKKPFKPIPELTLQNTVLFTDEQKAEALAKTFEQVHVLDPSNTPSQHSITQQTRDFLNQPYTPNMQELSTLLTKPTELHNIIKSLPNQKAPGPDNIQYIILKNLSRKALVLFTKIINAILQHQHFPQSWKNAHVIPIHKQNKNPKTPSSYRPISLLSTLSKVTEKVILIRLNKSISQLKLLPDFQFGFRPRHNTTQQLARVVTDISQNFNKNKVTVMALLDIEKAFDRVWQYGLIYKMMRAGIPTPLIKLIDSYFSNRSFQVKINSTLSNPHAIAAGVPQGGCLSPTLFSLYLHDIPTFPQTQTALYADDTALYASSHSAEVANKQLQIHINILTPYLERWKIKINHTKTEAIVFTRKFTLNTIHNPLKIYNHPVTPSKSTKYLGFHLENRLFHKQHIKQTLLKASHTVRSLYPLLNRNSNMSTDNKKLIYTTIIRPIITYAAPVWCNASHTALIPVQRFQNKCLRLILGVDRYARIQDLHTQTQIPYIHEFIEKLSQKFYTTQIHHNPLTRDIASIREHNAPFRIKHKLPYQTLPIFTQLT